MPKLSPTSTFDDVYQLDTIDSVVGGTPTVDGSGDADEGAANVPHLQLANRTKYLFDYADRVATGVMHVDAATPGLRPV